MKSNRIAALLIIALMVVSAIAGAETTANAVQEDAITPLTYLLIGAVLWVIAMVLVVLQSIWTRKELQAFMNEFRRHHEDD